MIPVYTPTTYVDDSAPPLSAANLNNLEQKMVASVNELRRLAGDSAAINTPVAFDATLRTGTWTFLGAHGAYDLNLGYMLGFLAVGINYDGSSWQAPGTAQGNGWAVIGVHADGNVYLYRDMSVGTAARTYTKAQFLAKRVGSLSGAPSALAQEGAVDGDVVTWDSATSRYMPKAVPGKVVVANTVAGLGAGVDGKVGLLRLGGSPFTFQNLHYDATYGKWVSPEVEGSRFVGGIASTVSTGSTFTDAVATQGMAGSPQPWKVRDDAALKPQFRVIGVFVQTATATLSVQPSYRGQDANSTAAGTSVAVTTAVVTSTQTGPVALDTGWGDIVGGYTVKDFITASLQTKHSAAGNVSISAVGTLGLGTSVKVRWVG
jgi:hypothetical protein